MGFELPEDTPVGSEVYTLKGEDPEGSQVFYTISGDYFSINKATGVITLRTPLDREETERIEVVITIQDEAFNLIPFRREILVLDKNDNAPQFLSAPYRFTLNETVPVGEVVFTSIAITDADKNENARITLECEEAESRDGVCETFEVEARELSTGSYVGVISLKRPLDHEERSSYNMILKAQDSASEGEQSLSATTNVFITVGDIQDQPPSFMNAPYSTTVQENTPPGTSIFQIIARDGDTGEPRDIELSIVGDSQDFFVLDVPEKSENVVFSTVLRKSDTTNLDREMEVILAQGGLYAFQVRAREIIEAGVFGDEAVSNVTIVVTDQNDEIPEFNGANFTVAVPEDVGADTPLPDLNIQVNDADISRNSEYDLILENVLNSDGVFTVYPTRAQGRTPVIIRVANPARLDYESEQGRNFVFNVNAVQAGKIMSSVTVNVIVTDANDNAPIFDQPIYAFEVPEDLPPGSLIGSITALDADSGRFGQVEYGLNGFGSEKFDVNPITGEISVAPCGADLLHCLDFETQQTFVLTFTGTDGGKQISTTALHIRVQDVNDNYPIFDQDEYLRVVEEQAMDFDVPLIIQARDIDGPAQGGGKIFYDIHSINSESTVFKIDPLTGEMSFVQPAEGTDTEKGRYEIVVRATDGGKPPLSNDVAVVVKVGSISNEKPRFEQPLYEFMVKEDATKGEDVAQVRATDPDGDNEQLRYHIHSGAKDNFVIDPKTGVISVAADANLDIQRNGDTYEIRVQVDDSGTPYKQTGETLVRITIQDINDKPPKFEQESYTVYVLESVPVGETVLQVNANDDDRNSVLQFNIVDPVTARDKTGNTLSNPTPFDFTRSFAIDPNDGRITVQEPLSHNSAAVIILTVEVKDVNAEDDRVDESEDDETTTMTTTTGKDGTFSQVDKAEVTFFIQAFRADSPQFAHPWTPSDPTLTFEIKEEQPIGHVLVKLSAKDPITGQPITQFEKVATSDPENLIDISPLTGEVISNQILDFEQRPDVTFQVRAIAEDRISDARVKLQLVDINDNAPIFEQESYAISIPESTFPLTKILTVKAMDFDTGDRGEIVYSISGQGEDFFIIDPKEGHLMVNAGPDGRSQLDREKQAIHEVQVIATDSPNGGPSQKATLVNVQVELSDVNDVPPQFLESRYSAVVAENSPPGTPVTSVKAEDPDLGGGGRVRYMFPPGVNADKKLFAIDGTTGEITTAQSLTGKGRQTPYVLKVRALDFGDIELFSDTDVYITVGDVSSNDGVPQFIKPEPNDVAHIAENANPGSKVYQVEAYDPDDPETANGKIIYSLPDDGTIIRKLFQIDPNNGIISTRVSLDREERSDYTLIIDIHDLGSPPQQTSRLLKVVVDDVDDFSPVFERQRNSVPLEIEVIEELPLGTVIGQISAIDEDEGENGQIDYAITYGNDDGIFELEVNENNSAIISVAQRLDREYEPEHLLTIKCFRPYERNVKSQEKRYDPSALDEIQVRIIIIDVDDNSPTFVERNLTLGVRVNAPVYTTIATLKAVDADADSTPITYGMENITYYRPRTNTLEILDNDIFLVDGLTGLLQTNQTLGRFADGYFLIFVKATNGRYDIRNGDFARLKVYVLQDTELMKFVFNRNPSVVQEKIPDFKRDIQEAFAEPLKFNIYETEFYSKFDGSLDFGRTSSCFQIIENENSLELKRAEELLDFSQNPPLKEILDRYDIVDIERCSTLIPSDSINWIEACIIVIAILIGLLTFISAIVLCCLYSNYKRNIHRSAPVKIVEAPVRTYLPTSLPPGSVRAAPSITGSDGRALYDWQESTIPMDVASYRSLPHH